MSIVRCRLVFVLAVILVFGEVTQGGEPEIGLVGNDQILWIYQRRDEDQGRVLRFSFRGAEKSTHEHFLPLQIPPVSGQIIRTAVCGVDLHVFYSDGSHYRYSPTIPEIRPISPPPRTFELDLPEAALPTAVAGDVATQMLYALIPFRVAARVDLENEAARLVEEARAKELSLPRPQPEKPVLSTVPEHSSTGFVIVRYERGRWQRDRDAPGELDLTSKVISMVARGATVHLFYSPHEIEKTVIHQYSAGVKEEWSKPTYTAIDSKSEFGCIGFVEDALVVVHAEREREGLTIRSTWFDNGIWNQRNPLHDADDRPHHFTKAVSTAVFEEALALASLNDEGFAQVERWSLTEGNAISTPAVVMPLKRASEPAISQFVKMLIQYAILMAVLFVFCVWRRDSVLAASALPRQFQLADLPRRMTALLIDLVIVSPAWVPTLYGLWRQGADGLSPMEQFAMGPAAAPQSLFWSWAILGTCLGIYAALFEAAGGATPGKRIVRLRVLSEKGLPCGLGRSALRNLVRAVEFHFPPAVLLVVLTPSRQRLGDLIARTVVVQAAPAIMLDDSTGDDETSETT